MLRLYCNNTHLNARMQLHIYTPTNCVLSDCVLSDGECIDVPVLPAWLELFFSVSPCLNVSAIVSVHCGSYAIQSFSFSLAHFLSYLVHLSKVNATEHVIAIRMTSPCVIVHKQDIKNAMLPIYCV